MFAKRLQQKHKNKHQHPQVPGKFRESFGEAPEHYSKIIKLYKKGYTLANKYDWDNSRKTKNLRKHKHSISHRKV